MVDWGLRFGLVFFDCLDLEAELFECAGELVLLTGAFCSIFVLELHLDGHELLDFSG